MGKSFYVSAYHAAYSRWSAGMGDREWQEWAEEVGRVKQAWKWAVAGMLTQLDREDSEIWHALGHAYQGGYGVERDLVQAETWLRKAAAAGHVRAMTKLGMLLLRDDRTTKDVSESFEWFLKAAELGDSSGMGFVGIAYREGRGITKDERKAADWFIKAYDAGNPTDAERAGNVLSFRSENHHEAVKWLRIAVDHGYDSAYCSLALIHEDRDSPAYDADEAFLCWSKVAERPRGDLRFFAMWRLASCCRDGVGTARNRDEAKRWLDRILAVAPKDKSDYRDALKRKREIDEELI